MEMVLSNWSRKSIALSLSMLILVFAVACGASAPDPAVSEPAAAQPAAAQPAPAQPAAASEPAAPASAAPAPAAVIAPAATAQAQPTPTPLPAEIISQGKINVLVGGFGSERFIARYCTGVCHVYGRLMHAYLATTTHEGGVIPEALERWEINEDGTEWILHMREGIKFHDGSDATIDDLLFSLVRMTDWENEDPEQTTTTQASHRRQIASQEITGPYEITATMHAPYAGFAVWNSNGHAGNLRMNLYPMKLLGEPYGPNEEAYEKLPMGAGPMEMIDRSPGQTMSFERFDDYYYTPEFGAPEDRRPRFQFLDLHNVPELSTRVAALRAGDGDLIEAAEAVKGQIEGAGGRMIYAKESTYVTIGLERCYLPETNCNDIRVRQALDLAIDRQSIVDTLYSPEEYNLGGWNYVTPTSLGYTPELAPQPFDPDKARELMAAAGYKVPGSPGGNDYGVMEIVTWNPGDVPFIPDMAQLIADNWATELGLETKVTVTDRTLISQQRRGGELVGKARLFINEARWDGSTITHSSFNDPDNVNRYAQDPRLWETIRTGFNVTAPEERHDALAKVFPELQAEHYQLAMGYTNLPWGASKRIKEWQPWSAAAFFNAHWTVRIEE
jgi:peptide/nickel transport system substrate-binding protein